MKQLVIANAQHVLFVLRYARNEDGIRHGREIRYVCLIHSSSKQLVLLPAIHIVYTNESASLRHGGKQCALIGQIDVAKRVVVSVQMQYPRRFALRSDCEKRDTR